MPVSFHIRGADHKFFCRNYLHDGKFFGAFSGSETMKRNHIAHCANLNSSHEHSSVQCDFQMSNLIKNDAAALFACECG